MLPNRNRIGKREKSEKIITILINLQEDNGIDPRKKKRVRKLQDIIGLLEDTTLPLLDFVDDWDRNCLHLVCAISLPDAKKIVTLFVQNYGFDVECLDAYGQTPVHICAVHQNYECLKYLVKFCGADCTRRSTSAHSRTPLNTALNNLIWSTQQHRPNINICTKVFRFLSYHAFLQGQDFNDKQKNFERKSLLETINATTDLGVVFYKTHDLIFINYDLCLSELKKYLFKNEDLAQLIYNF
eukprot:UN33463